MRQDDPARFAVVGTRVVTGADAGALRDLHVSDGAFVDGFSARPAEIVEARGAYAVPLLVQSAVDARPRSERNIYDLRPGNPATFALIRSRVSQTQIRRMLVVNPADLAAVYVDGHLEVWDGAETRPAGDDLTDPATAARWVGTWDDPGHALQQHLLPNGRYSETRGGRENAFTGRYWIRGDRITYLDDSGFWAFGELLGATLHHAGFVMNRRSSWV